MALLFHDPNVLDQIADEEADGATGYKLYLTKVACDQLPRNSLGPRLMTISSLLHRFVTPQRDIHMVMIYLGYALKVVQEAFTETFEDGVDGGTPGAKLVPAYIQFYDQVLDDFATLGLDGGSLDAYNDHYQKLYDQSANLCEIVGSWEQEGRFWAKFGQVLGQIIQRELNNIHETKTSLAENFLTITAWKAR